MVFGLVDSFLWILFGPFCLSFPLPSTAQHNAEHSTHSKHIPWPLVNGFYARYYCYIPWHSHFFGRNGDGIALASGLVISQSLRFLTACIYSVCVFLSLSLLYLFGRLGDGRMSECVRANERVNERESEGEREKAKCAHLALATRSLAILSINENAIKRRSMDPSHTQHRTRSNFSLRTLFSTRSLSSVRPHSRLILY